MSAPDLDPILIKGLRLLHSKAKDSTEQLKQLLDEVIAQSKQPGLSKDRLYTSVKMDNDKIHLKKETRDVIEVSGFSSKFSSDDSRERKAEKRHIGKDSPEGQFEAKIPKLDTPHVHPYYNAPSPDLPKLDLIKKDEDTDSSEENADADDFAFEMGLACVMCKQLDVTQGNQLIECLECHNLYHQECHRPPVTDYDYNDVRRVWYCSKCVKNMKKLATKPKPVKPSVTVPAREPMLQTKSTKSEGSPPALMLPFKRTELKPVTSQTPSQATNKPIGLAGFAANFGNRAGAVASTTSSTATARSTKTAPTDAKKLSPFTSMASKLSPSSTFQSISLSTTASTSSSSIKSLGSPGSSGKGLSLLSAAVQPPSVRNAAVVAAAALAGGNGNSHKSVSYSPMMSADKRLQIMKKKASKLQDKRRLSNK